MSPRAYIGWADAITPLGADWAASWAALLAGRSAIRAWDAAGAYACEAHVAGIEGLERGLDGSGHSTARRLGERMMARIAASRPGPAPVFGAANHGDSDRILALAPAIGDAHAASDPAAWSCLLLDPVPHAFGTDLAGWNASACSSGLHAVIDAMMELASGADAAYAVAIDALSPIEVAGFARAGACGDAHSHPFALDRSGLAIGEAAAAIRIDRCGKNALAAILGAGMSCDAWHPTDPHPDGAGVEQAIRRALDNARLDAADVAAIVAHGTATKKNDAIEAAVFRRLWPGRPPLVTSLKHGLGHTMGAAGMLNLIAAAQSSGSGWLPPIGQRAFDAEPGIRAVTGAPHAIPRGAPVLALASGFGGNNVAVVVGS